MKNIRIISSILLIIIVLSTIFFSFNRNVEERSWRDYNIVVHALGEINGHVDTNTKEALIENYFKGSRVFEVDLHWTTDNHLVAIHPTRVLRKIADEATVTLNDILDNDFYKEKGLTPLSFEDLAILMIEFPDIYIITDTRSIDKETVQNQFNYIYEVANRIDPTILERIIPQLYSFSMFNYIEEIYQFNEYILTLYQMPEVSNDDIFEFLYNHDKVTALALPYNSPRLTKDFIDDLNKMNVLIYVHTVSDISVIIDLYNKGVWGFYSPNITEDYIKRNEHLRFRAEN